MGSSCLQLVVTFFFVCFQKTSLIFRNKKGPKVEKGVAFPVCLSVNNCVCHYSPLASDESVVLALGDVVKLDLGVHVDGFIAVAAHTFRVTATGTALCALVVCEHRPLASHLSAHPPRSLTHSSSYQVASWLTWPTARKLLPAPRLM